MADYIAQDTDFTLVANAIRAKTGDSGLLEWPIGFKTAIDNIVDTDCIKTVGPSPVVSVSDAAPLDAEGLVVDIEPVQEGSGDPSPDNVRPITGWTGANVTRTRGNLFNVRACTPYNQNVTLTFNDDGSMTCENRNNYAVIPTISAVLNLPSGTYTVSTDGTLSANAAFYASDDGVNYAWYANALGASTKNRTVTLDKPYVQLRWQVGANSTDTLPPIMFEYGSTYHSYEPYQGETHGITFPTEAGTVYGGTLDVTKGELVVDRAMVTFDGSNDEYWYTYDPSAYDSFCFAKDEPRKNIDVLSSICDKYKNVMDSWGAGGKGKFGVFSDHVTLKRWYFRPPNSTFEKSVSAWKAWLGENPLTVVYGLDTPITYQLTPQQVALLRGNNTLWADTGDATLKYFTTAFEDLAEEIGFADGGDY